MSWSRKFFFDRWPMGAILQLALASLLWLQPRAPHHLLGRAPLLSGAGCGVAGCRRRTPTALAPTLSLAAPSSSFAAGPELSVFELCADGRVTPYQSTLTSMHTRLGVRLSARDVRLLRSSTPVLAVRPGFVLFDLGEAKGVLLHDRVVMVGSDRQKVRTIGEEVQHRLDALSRANGSEEYPFEVRVLEAPRESTWRVAAQGGVTAHGPAACARRLCTSSPSRCSSSRCSASPGSSTTCSPR